MESKRPKVWTPEQALLQMAGLCARSEQSPHDLIEKMRKHGINPEVAAKIVENLQSRGFVDVRRYARALVNDKVRFSGWGRNKIRMLLAAKLIPGDVASEALEQVDEALYAGILEKCAVAKARSCDLKQVEDRRKLYRHLMARGFESSMAIAAVKEQARRQAEERSDG